MNGQTMRVIEVSGYGYSDVLESTGRPVPEPDEVQVCIDVRAASINYADIVQR